MKNKIPKTLFNIKEFFPLFSLLRKTCVPDLLTSPNWVEHCVMDTWPYFEPWCQPVNPNENCNIAVKPNSFLYFSVGGSVEMLEIEDDTESSLWSNLRFLKDSRFKLNTFRMRQSPRVLGLTLDFHLLSSILWGIPGLQAISDVSWLILIKLRRNFSASWACKVAMKVNPQNGIVTEMYSP